MKIIDSHVHLVETLAGFGGRGELRYSGNGNAMWADGEEFPMFPPQLGEGCVTPEKLIRLMDDHNVEKAVLLQGGFYGFQNQYTWQAVQKYPGRLTGAAAYDPFCFEMESVRRHLFDDLGFRIVKFELSTGSGLMSSHAPFPLDGVELRPVFEDAAERGLLFVIDIGAPGTPSWQIEALRRVALRYKDMRFVVCHLMAPRPGEEEDLQSALGRLALDNVWFDISALPANTAPETSPWPTARRYVHMACGLLGADRLLFGSDIPSTITRTSYQSLIDMVLLDEGLTGAQKEQILYQNAQRLFFA